MKLFWKGVAVLSLAIAGIGATAVPAQAQHYGGNGWRGDRDRHWDNRRGDNRRWDNRRRDDRRWNDRRFNDRRDWRGHRGDWRGQRGYRTRCWNEWRYDRYRDRRVRARICR